MRGGGGIKQFLGSALWLYPRRGAPVSLHALEAAVDRLRRLAHSVDTHTYEALMNRCAHLGARQLGVRVAALTESGAAPPPTLVVNVAIRMYGRLGMLPAARAAFRRLCRRGGDDVLSWQSMAQVEAEAGASMECLATLRSMLQAGHRPTAACLHLFVALLARCRLLRSARVALLHWRAHEPDAEAERKAEPEAELEAEPEAEDGWAELVAAYTSLGRSRDAIRLAANSAHPSPALLAAVVAAAGAAGNYTALRGAHLAARRINVEGTPTFVAELVAAYARCGNLREAREAFEARFAVATHACWAAMLAAYVQCGATSEALALHRRMDQHGVVSDGPVYSMLLSTLPQSDGDVLRRRALSEGWQLG